MSKHSESRLHALRQREQGRPLDCDVCGSTDGVRKITVFVGDAIQADPPGEPLRLQPKLCHGHSSSYILRMGMLLGTLNEPLDEVFRERFIEQSPGRKE